MRRNVPIYILFLAAFLLTGCRSARQVGRAPFVVVIDAGHGGNDQGAAGRRTLEKDVTLQVARRVAKQIRKHGRGVEVIQTRPDDGFVTLDDRAGMANYFGADLFISIHANSSRTWAVGTETFIHPTAKGSRSERLARYMEEEYASQGGRNSRGVKTANFAVLRKTRMPAVLTEVGFISNKDEERFISSRKGQKRLARCIRDAFLRYHGACR